MFLVISRIVTAIALICLGPVNACKPSPNAQYISQLPICSSIPSISLDIVIDPTLAYLRPTEIGLENPSLSASPEYFAASAGAIAMTETLNEIFQDFRTVHSGPNSLVGIPFPIVLNQTGGLPCVSIANLTVIPQYNLAITEIGTSNTYLAEGNQGVTNNRQSCQLCNSPSPPFAIIHGTLDNAGLYDVTSQVCNAFNVPTIAVSITDLTFQKLYPEAAASAHYSALASIGPTQIGAALNQLMIQFGWQSVTVFLDPTNTAQTNEVIRGFQVTGLGIYSQFVDYYGTGCSNGIIGVLDGSVSIIYIDLTISRVADCIRQMLSGELSSLNYIIIWGPTLMASVNNSFQNLAGAVGLSLANFTGTFTLQVRTRDASYSSLLQTNLQQLYNTWNDPAMFDSLDIYPTALYDNANAVILASQGIYGLLASKICVLIGPGMTLNLPDSLATPQTIAEKIAFNFASILSSLAPRDNYTVITPTATNNRSWNIQLNTANLNIVPNSAFYFYTQTSGYWSEASNTAKWYHDSLGNSLTTFDVYNLQTLSSPLVPIGSYFSGSYSWVYNSSVSVIWPNSSALWQYNSGFPGDTPPLSSLSISCLAGYSCPSTIVSQSPTYQGFSEIVSYSTTAVISDQGTWEMGIQCLGGGGTLFYTTSIELDNPDSFPAWSMSLNQRTAQVQLTFDSVLVDPNKWAGGGVTLAFSCFDKNNILNGTLHITIDNNESQYTPSTASQWIFVTLNSLGIASAFIGAGLTIFYRHHRPIYSSSIPFLLIALLGFSIIFGSGVISILPVSGDGVCQAKSWMFNYGFVLVMGSLLLKTFHIHKIFNNDKLIIYRISFWQFTLSLASMLAVVTVVMLVWQNVSDLNLHRNNTFQPYCVTGSWVPFHIIAGFELLLVLACLWLGYQIRKVHHDYNESKYVGFIVYNTAIWGITWWVMASQISISPATLSLLTSLFICVVCFLNAMIFFAPKFYAISIETTYNRGLVVTPRQGSNKLAHSKDSDDANSALGPSLKSQPKSLGKPADEEFVLPQDGKDALKFARDKLFEVARKWKTNEGERIRLQKKVGECEALRVKDSECINTWMAVIRNVLTSGQVTAKDSEALILQMWRILSMRGSELIEEAEKYESARKKKETVPSLGNVNNAAKASMSVLEMTNANLASSAVVSLPKPVTSSASTFEMVTAVGSPSLKSSSMLMSEIGVNTAHTNSITRRNHI